MALAVVVLILVLRYRFQHSTDRTAPRLQKKTSGADVFRFSGMFFRVSLVVVLAFVVLAFNWTVFERTDMGGQVTLEEPIDLMVVPPPTAFPPPPTPPPPPPKIEPVIDDERVDDTVFESDFVDATTDYVPSPPAPVQKTPVYVPPPAVAQQHTELFKVVEDMPCFGKKCTDDTMERAEKRTYSDTEVIQFLNKNIKYPALARENGVEGRVVVSFIVEKNGQITNIKILREPGAGLGTEAVRVVALMNEAKYGWIAGKQQGNTVRVEYNLPINFKLN